MGVRGKALVAGALGVVGRNFVHHLLQSGQWDVVGLSRSAAEPQAGYQHIPVDLLDPDDCARALSSLSDVTHIFYAARTPDPDFATEAELNLRFLCDSEDVFVNAIGYYEGQAEFVTRTLPVGRNEELRK